MRGIELLVFNYLSGHPDSSKHQIVVGTGCCSVPVSNALQRLKKQEYVVSTQNERGHHNMLYRAVRPCTEERCDVSICGKHYSLTGAQMQALRDQADEFEMMNGGE